MLEVKSSVVIQPHTNNESVASFKLLKVKFSLGHFVVEDFVDVSQVIQIEFIGVKELLQRDWFTEVGEFNLVILVHLEGSASYVNELAQELSTEDCLLVLCQNCHFLQVE